jgi:hypothetical protein
MEIGEGMKQSKKTASASNATNLRLPSNGAGS